MLFHSFVKSLKVRLHETIDGHAMCQNNTYNHWRPELLSRVVTKAEATPPQKIPGFLQCSACLLLPATSIVIVAHQLTTLNCKSSTQKCPVWRKGKCYLTILFSMLLALLRPSLCLYVRVTSKQTEAFLVMIIFLTFHSYYFPISGHFCRPTWRNPKYCCGGTGLPGTQMYIVD